MAEDIDIPVNIKDYIINSRKAGYPDSKIMEMLKKSNWPEDIIETAKKDADQIIAAVQEKKQDAPAEAAENPNQVVPPAKVEKTEMQKIMEQVKPPKKHFSFLAVIALLLSPIPFLGLMAAGAALDNIYKNNKSGGIIAIIALIINMIVIIGFLWLILQIFTVDPQNLVGIAKILNEKFNFLQI